MDRVTTTLEMLIGIIKATEPPKPQPSTLHFDPVTTAPSSIAVDTNIFSFFRPQLATQQALPGQHNSTQGVPGNQHAFPEALLPFPSHEHPGVEGQGSNQIYLEPQKITELWFSGETKQLAFFLRAI
jgi:hypothetical protein